LKEAIASKQSRMQRYKEFRQKLKEEVLQESKESGFLSWDWVTNGLLLGHGAFDM